MSRMNFLSVLAYFVFVSSIFAQQSLPTAAPAAGNSSNPAAISPTDSSFTAVCLRSVSGTGQNITAASNVVTTTSADTIPSFTSVCLSSVKNAGTAQESSNVSTTSLDTIPSFTDICLKSVKNTAANPGTTAGK